AQRTVGRRAMPLKDHAVRSTTSLRQAAFKTLREDKTPADLEESVRKSAVKHAIAKRQTRKLARAVTPGDHVRITHPERIVFPQIAATKADVVAYYRAVAPWMLQEIATRP